MAKGDIIREFITNNEGIAPSFESIQAKDELNELLAEIERLREELRLSRKSQDSRNQGSKKRTFRRGITMGSI